MRGRFGMETAEFDPSKKYFKPAGFGAGDAPHYQYIEYGRKPWQYRPAGSFIIPDDRWLPQPRVCRDLRGITEREALLTSIGAAVALDVQEIALDLPGDELLETILRKFACHVIFNIHLPCGVSMESMERVFMLARRYDCAGHVVLAAADAQQADMLHRSIPQLIVRSV